MLKFLAKVMDKHPELCRFLEQVRQQNRTVRDTAYNIIPKLFVPDKKKYRCCA